MKNLHKRHDSPLHIKSYAFALRAVRMAQYLHNERQEYILSKQVLRSGTAIGALVRESEFAQSPADFINKLSVGLKEANETDYWLNLLHDSNQIDEQSFISMEKLIALLVASIKTVKNNQKKNEGLSK